MNENNPWKEVEYFEKELAEFTGAPYCVAVDSCTNAFFLVLEYYKIKNQTIVFPRRTYLSMPMMALAKNNKVAFVDKYNWESDGFYEIYLSDERDKRNIYIYDSAKILYKNEFKNFNNFFANVSLKSFHMKKIITSLSGKGGAILTNDKNLYEWALKARWEGREPYSDYKDKEQDISIIGYNMNMTPEEALFLRRQLSCINNKSKILYEPEGYRNLDEFTVFKDCKVYDRFIDFERDKMFQELTFSNFRDGEY